MIQDIQPKVYHVEYHDLAPRPSDTLLLFEGDAAYARQGEDGASSYPKFNDLARTIEEYGAMQIKFRYLFSIDEERFFMADIYNTAEVQAPEGFKPSEGGVFRSVKPQYLAFAGITAQQIRLWYTSHKFCGRCGTQTGHSETERAIVCPQCGLIEYPKIAPVVITAVTNGEDLLVTRYKGWPERRYALVAGFSEVGETLEDTARREVFEETGVHIKNLRYYKSQPWALSSSLISGFFCELDGDPSITIDENELSEATWLRREEVPQQDNTVALTAEMMEAFRTGDK